MKNIVTILILITLFLVHSSMTTAITFNNNISINTQTNKILQGQIPVYYDNATPHTFAIYNVTITGLSGFNFTEIPILLLNESKNINYTYKTDTPIHQTYSAKLQYNYLTQGTRTPLQKVIQVNTSGYNPSNTTAYINDSVVWFNNGEGNRTVTNLNDLTDKHIIQNLTNYTRLFSSTAQFDYFDETTQKGGFLTILSNEVTLLTHSADYDKNILFNVDAIYKNADMSGQAIPDSYSMKLSEVKQGILRLETNDSVFNIKLSGEWFRFQENNLNLNGDKLIAFNITPAGITTTAQTNQTYLRNIVVVSDNGGNLTIPVSVFIQYANLTEITETLQNLVLLPMTIEQQYAFCNDAQINWTHPTCVRYLQNVSKVEYVARVLYPEINETSAFDSLQSGKKAEEGVIRLTNQIDSQKQELSSLREQLQLMFNSLEAFSTTQTTKINDIGNDVIRRKNNSTLFLWSTLLIFFTIICVVGVVFYKKWKFNNTPSMQFKV